ncbi:ABC transporter ATP-binding protein [Actinomadura viridis]|uniref:Branched-chain amino acid transport system ATP-binding protein n=1 Tax=Actinomadura viridis TaxID=58110 RepID=A0A931GMK4_9ACTN|nr:ABC transporter ATP-binding protein [Actinomadura viridis]MBG6092747.1 branched-chain amino acid transport system ATP-binding protein [Actinomadura viridis]
MSPPALTVNDLSVDYGPVRALREVSLRVPEGGFAAVLGGNGAGKTTLLRAVSGVLPFHGGTVRAGRIAAAGTSLRGRRPDRIVGQGVVQVPEGREIFARMTVGENLRAGALGARDRRAVAAARDRVLRLFPVLAERERQRAGLLSGGEQQMLAIGRALMAGPRLLLLDEPSLGLAPIMIDRIAATIRAINGEGIAVLLIEQNAALALELASHAYVLEVGAVALEGPAPELASSPEVRDRYLGVSTGAAEEEPVAAGPARTLGRWTG